MWTRATNAITNTVGTPGALLAAFVVVFVWAASGPTFGFSDTWQLVINTSTTIVTFLMVFVIQAGQNRDTRALHAKLDALIAANPDADDSLRRVEERSPREIEELRDNE